MPIMQRLLFSIKLSAPTHNVFLFEGQIADHNSLLYSYERVIANLDVFLRQYQ